MRLLLPLAVLATVRPVVADWASEGWRVSNVEASVLPSVHAAPVERWRVSLDGAVLGTALVDDTNPRVFVGSRGKLFYALSAATGEELWRYEAGGEVLSTPALAFGGAVVVFATANGRIIAADSASGARLWSVALNANIHSSPIVSRDGYVRVHVCFPHCHRCPGA